MASRDAFLRRGQLHMLIAAPGVGKSVLATAYVVQSGVKTLYLSLDTDAHTTCSRAASAATGYPLTMVEKALTPGQEQDWVIQVLRDVDNVRYAFTSAPDSAEIGNRIVAYSEAAGEYPELVVVDNLGNVSYDDEEFTGMRRLTRDLQSVAGKTRSAVLVLHHAVGQYEDGNRTIPMSGINGKVSKFPAMILTAHRAQPGAVTLSVVKNRFGRADPLGWGVKFDLLIDLSCCWVADPPYAQEQPRVTST